MCELEGGAGCALFPCGAAAVANTILAFVEQGDHILMTNSAYEPSQDFCTKILTKLGVTTSWFDPMIGSSIVRLIQPNTKIVFLESQAPSPWKFMTYRQLCRRSEALRQRRSL
jgi:cystathionine beta-lyase